MSIIGITGGTGLVGHHLAPLLVAGGHDVVIFTRRTAAHKPEPHITYAHWNIDAGSCDINALKTIDAIVHLAGEGIADKRWTEKRKREIRDSRVKGTELLVGCVREHAVNCKAFVSASAIGFYGEDKGGKPFTETDVPAGDFLGTICQQWEATAHKADDFLRTVVLRFGIVLGKEGGAFAKFSKPMSFGIVPVLGGGNQVMSWIAVDDLARLIVFALDNEQIAGVYNAVAPNPVTNKELVKTIAAVKGGIKIPAPVPASILKVMLGEMSTEILKSCTVSAQKTLSAGFTFKYPDALSATKAILDKG